MPEPFARPDDLEAGWRTLTPAEEDRADTLLRRASALIRSRVRGIDARIAAGTLDPEVPLTVVCAMVKRAMQGPSDLDGVTQQQRTAGPFMQGVTFANPSGNLYLTKSERADLRGGGTQYAFSIDPTPPTDPIVPWWQS